MSSKLFKLSTIIFLLTTGISYGQDNDPVYQITEEPAAFEGGMAAFFKYISTNMKYPDDAKSNGISGNVFVQFIVEKNGQLTVHKIIKKLGSGCDEEARRLLEECPPWNPGKQGGEAVRVMMTLPIRFKIPS